jgi:hypothetical protein
LEFAYTLYLEGRCDICGGSKFECRNEANAGLYEVADTTCHRQAAVEEHTGQQGFKPDPGQRFYATEIDPELVTRRTFAPFPGTNDQDNEPGDGDESGEGV